MCSELRLVLPATRQPREKRLLWPRHNERSWCNIDWVLCDCIYLHECLRRSKLEV